MDFISLAAFMAFVAGSQAPPLEPVEATCCKAEAAKAPAKVAKVEGYICPLTGAVLPCPSCCPATAKAEK